MPRRQGASGRVPAHQNTHKFHHNANSKYTKTVSPEASDADSLHQNAPE